jgi:hypothetical protein
MCLWGGNGGGIAGMVVICVCESGLGGARSRIGGHDAAC